MPLPAASCLTAGRNLSFGKIIGASIVLLFSSQALVAQQPISVAVSAFANLYQRTDPATKTRLSTDPEIIRALAVPAGAKVTVTATGCVTDAGTSCTDANGFTASWTIRGLRPYSLIGRWSRSQDVLDATTIASAAFFVGISNTLTAPSEPGTYYLVLGENDDGFDDNLGQYLVTLSCQTCSVVITTTAIGAVKVGTLSTQTLTAAQGTPPYSWAIASGSLPPGMQLTADGIFTGTPTAVGSSTFTVRVTDTVGATASKMFAVNVVFVLPPPIIRVHIISSSSRAVPGREIDYFILVENTGDTVATNVEVVEPLPEQLRLVSVSPPGSADIDTLATNSLVHWLIPEVAPHENRVLTYRVRMSSAAPTGGTLKSVTYMRAVSSLDTSVASSWMECIYKGAKVSTSPLCLFCLSVCEVAVSACSAVLPAPLTILPCLQTAAPCIACVVRPDPKDPQLSSCFTKVGNTIKACWDAIKASAQAIAELIQSISGPIDPNEKLVANQKYIQPDQVLLYTVNFENIGDVEARDVFITDVLDPNLDIYTLQRLTPGATFDAATRTIKWNLLNRNLPPGGTDNVLLSIKPKPNLPSGTVIKNKATIQFEIFKPLTTNETENIIDTTAPQCVVSALQPETTATSFPVSWTGTDAVGEIETYSVFVSTNGGGFKPLIATKDTSTMFSGLVGNTYSFLCVAKDTAENVESQAEVAEATTRIVEGNGAIPGDVNRDGKVDCADVAIVQAALGKKAGQPGFDARADVVKDDVIDVRDLAFVSQKLPAGTRCKP